MSSPCVSLLDLSTLVRRVVHQQAEFSVLVAALQPLLGDDRPLNTELALALSTALHAIEREALEADSLHSLLLRQAAPALAINEAGQILAVNTAMLDLGWALVGDGLSSLGVSQADFKGFKQRCLELAQPSLLVLASENLEQDAPERPLLMMGYYQYPQQVFVLVALQQRFPNTICDALMQLYGLSAAECEVLAALAAGLSSEHIAQKRARKVTTIRQQVKAITTKMGVDNQIQAATLAAAAAHSVLQFASNRGPIQNQDSTQQAQQWLADTPELSLYHFFRDGRRVAWRRFGHPNGQKVLFIHGPSFAAGDFEQDRDWAQRLGLDVYAIERPGYGRTDPPGPDDDPLDCQVQDIQLLIRYQRLARVKILAHEVGLIPALAFARLQPDQVSSLVGVSCAPPFVELEQIQAMPTEQGVFILAATKARWLARLLLRLLVARLRTLGARRWYQAVFGQVPLDLAVTERPDLQPGVAAAFTFYTQQAGAGFDNDLQVMIKDWGYLVSQAPCPVLLLHGQSNPSTPAAHLDLFLNLNRRWQIQTFADQGLTLALCQPEAIFTAVKASR